MHKKDFDNHIGHKIRMIHNYIGKFYNTSLENAGVEPTRMQCATMRYLCDHQNEDVFQKDLEAAFSISGATATNILKVMEKDGLVSRVPMPTDARLKKLEMTDKGQALAETAHIQMQRLEEGMKKGFTEEELTIFRGYMDRLAQNIVDLLEENTK